ncbi:MAG: hypothetical protein K8S54_10490 [Spirochaetia bacterium]|nr:hypothetical protein [Spirochaetia bacterium]
MENSFSANPEYNVPSSEGAALYNEHVEKWKELIRRKEEFLRILQLLVEFDERTGRHLKYEDGETHYLRRAVCTADPSRTRILIRDLGSYMYSVVCETRNTSALAVIAYIHEDGIRVERDKCDPDHPTQSITCVTDLFEKATEAFDTADLSTFARDLMDERAK